MPKRSAFENALRWFFRHFYHDLAWTYDPVSSVVSIGRWNAWIQAVLPHLQGPRVLEIAFGTGRLQESLIYEGSLITVGLEESRQMIALTKKRLGRRGSRTTSFIRGRAEALPLAGDTFDSVVSTFPTEFITRAATLQQIRRVLRPGGRLIVLPAAWIVGAKMVDRLAAGLFRATHQVPSDLPGTSGSRFSKVISDQGFSVTTHRIELRDSLVLILVGTADT